MWVLVPLQAVGLLAWWFYKAWTWVAETDGDGAIRPFGERLAELLDPSAVFGLGTCLLQWGVVIGVLLLVNKQLARRSLAEIGVWLVLKTALGLLDVVRLGCADFRWFHQQVLHRNVLGKTGP